MELTPTLIVVCIETVKWSMASSKAGCRLFHSLSSSANTYLHRDPIVIRIWTCFSTLFPEIGQTRRASLSAKATEEQLEHMLSLVIDQEVQVKVEEEIKMAVVRQVDRFNNSFQVLVDGVVRKLHASRIADKGIYCNCFSSLM